MNCEFKGLFVESESEKKCDASQSFDSLFYVWESNNPLQTAKQIDSVYGNGVITESSFLKFQTWWYCLEIPRNSI